MGCIQSYFKKAQSSGVSPSSTEESNSKGVLDQGSNDDGRTSISNQEDKPPEEPESNDTSYGVEATAVRTLAASTGTVAILGTTAQSQSQKDLRKAGDSPDAVCTQPLPGATPLVKTDEKTVVPQSPDEKEKFSEPTNDVGDASGKDTKEAPELEAKDEEKTTPDSPVTVKEIKTEDPKIPEEKTEIPTTDSKPKSPESDKTLEEPDTKASTESDIKSENEIKPAEQLTKDLQQPLVDKIEESEVTSKAEPITEQMKPNEAESLVSESLPAVAISEEPTADKINEITNGEVKSDSLSEALIQSPNASSEDTSKVPEVVSPDEKTVVKEALELIESVVDEIQAEKPKKTDEIQSPNQDENSESLSAENEVSLPSPDGNTRTNDDEDNDISSEQLKTNSLSDVSMSETVQSEVEEKSLVGEQLPVESENKDSEITKEIPSPVIEVSSPSDASVKNVEGNSEISPDSKTDVTSLDEKSQNSSSNDADLNAAATTIQSTIRGFLVRKQLQGSQNSSNEDLSKKLTDSMIEKVKDEVNDICKEAEKTTESLISSPDIDKDAIIPNEEFPAPPDDMLTEARDETTTSLNSQPTVPSSESQKETNIQDQKSDETQAEPLKENALDAIPPMPADSDDNSAALNEQLPNDEDLPAPDFEMLESSYTEDMNTEIANDSDKVTNAEDELKDSTENDLTIDEDSEKQLKELQKPQECDELRIAAEQIVDLTQKEIDNAATKIQAGVRGFLTRKQQSKKGKKNGADTPKESLSSPSGNGRRIDDSAVDKEVWNTLESEINKAATTIQANFRGYMVRKEGKNGESPDVSQDTVTFNSEPPSSLNGTNSPITAKDDAPPSSEGLTTNGTEAESQKDILDSKEEPTKGDDSTQDSAESKNLSEDLINDSALKIQAGVRGYLVRKKQQSEKEAAAPVKTETSNNDQN